MKKALLYTLRFITVFATIAFIGIFFYIAYPTVICKSEIHGEAVFVREASNLYNLEKKIVYRYNYEDKSYVGEDYISDENAKNIDSDIKVWVYGKDPNISICNQKREWIAFMLINSMLAILSIVIAFGFIQKEKCLQNKKKKKDML